MGSKITVDGDWSHEIKRHLLLGRKAMTNLDSVLKSRDVNLSTKFFLVKAMIFRYSFSSITLKVSKQGICSQKLYIHRTVQFSSVTQLCPTLCDPWTATCQASLSVTNSQRLLKLMSTELVMPSNHLILCCPLVLLPSIFPSIRVWIEMSQFFAPGDQSIGASASAFPTNIQDWFPFRLTSLIFLLSKWLSRIFSVTTIKSINFSPSLHPALTLVPDYWKNHSFNYMELCQQSDVSVFLIHCLGLS